MPDPNSFRGPQNKNRQALWDAQAQLPPELEPSGMLAFIEQLGFDKRRMPTTYTQAVQSDRMFRDPNDNPYIAPDDYEEYMRRKARENAGASPEMINLLTQIFMSDMFTGEMPMSDTKKAEQEAQRKREAEQQKSDAYADKYNVNRESNRFTATR